MEGFCDSGKFTLEEVEDTGGHKYVTPVHWRDLGEKKGELYPPRVSWSDVAINGVPLEKTFVFEDDILRLQEEKDDREQGKIMVNSRPVQPPTCYEEVEDKDKRWVRRLEKLYPMNFQEAKKKRKSIERFPVKPKGKKQVRDEKLYSSADKFQEITDEKLGGESVLDYTIYIQKKGDYKIIEELDMMTPSDPWYPHRYIIYKVPIRTKYCPPLHWLEPEVQWEKIWCHVDELKTGEKRAYDYFPTGFQDFIIGLKARSTSSRPCIFFNDDSGEFVGSRDYMDENEYWGMNYVSDYYHY